MRRRLPASSIVLVISFLAGSLVVPLLAPAASAYGERPYEWNQGTSTTAPVLVYNLQSAAQSFVATQTYRLLNVSLRISNPGSFAIEVSVRPDAAGAPSYVVLASNQITGPGTVGWVSIPFTSPPVLAQGSRYWIVVSSTADSTRAYRWYHANSDSYPNGWASVNVSGAGWTAVTPATDLYFLTFAWEAEANVTGGIAATRPMVTPKDLLTFTIYHNNSGANAARRVWVNVTLPAGLTRVSDNASANSSTLWPRFTFDDVANGIRYFVLTVRADIGTTPGTVLTTRVDVTFADSTWAVRPSTASQAAVTVGLATKPLYLAPDAGPAERLTPIRPTGTVADQVNLTLLKGGTTYDFDLEPPLFLDFRVLNLTVTLYLDSDQGTTETLSMDLALVDWNGVSYVPVASLWKVFTTNNLRDFQKVTFVFSPFDWTFPSGHQIRLRISNYANSTDHAVLAFNSTFADSHLDLLTPTYVQVDTLVLQDRVGPASIWSPKDPLRVVVNVSDPFGSTEIAASRVNITAPGGALVVNNAAMTLVGQDSLRKSFEYTYGPALANGTYVAEVVAVEGSGAFDFAAQSATVRAPSLTVRKIATMQNVRSGDRYDYLIWVNNTSPSSAAAATVWINDTLPAEVNLLGSNPAGNQTGNLVTWTYTSVDVGRSLVFDLTVQVRGGISAVPYFTNTVSVNYSDEKGYLWPAAITTSSVAFRSPVIDLTLASSKSQIHSEEEVTFTYTLTNTGEAATGLWLNHTLPSAMTRVSDTVAFISGTSTVAGNVVHFYIPGIAATTSLSFSMTARTGADLPYGLALLNTAGLNYTNSGGFFMPPEIVSTTLTLYAPYVPSVFLTMGSFTAKPGEIVWGVVDYSNVGNEAASDVWINITMDSHLAFYNGSVSPAISSQSLSFWSRNVGTGAQHLYFNLTVSTSVPSRYAMQIDGILTYADAIGNILPVRQIAPRYVEAIAPMMALSVSPLLATIEAGTEVTYSVNHANAGSGTAGDVWLNLSLPASLVYVSDDSDGERTVAGSEYTWHWRNLDPGPKSFSLRLFVKTSVADGSTANLTFRSEYTDENGNWRNGATVIAQATFSAPVIELELRADRSQVPAGSPVSYNLRIRNSGSATAATVWLLDSVDERLEIVSFNSSVAASGDQSLNWTYVDFAPGQVEEFTLVVRVREGLPARTLISNVLEAAYTNSVGVVIGYARSAPVTMTILPDLSLLPYILGIGSALGVVAVVIVRRRMHIEIEEAFLVYRDGVLMYHLSRSLVQDKDEDVLSGMLTAVQEFVRDAFRYGEHRELHQLDFGDYRILIERGKLVYLAVVYSGNESASLRKKVRGVLDHIETTYRPVLEKWDGDMDKVVGARDAIRDILLKPNGRHIKAVAKSA